MIFSYGKLVTVIVPYFFCICVLCNNHLIESVKSLRFFSFVLSLF